MHKVHNLRGTTTCTQPLSHRQCNNSMFGPRNGDILLFKKPECPHFLSYSFNLVLRDFQTFEELRAAIVNAQAS